MDGGSENEFFLSACGTGAVSPLRVHRRFPRQKLSAEYSHKPAETVAMLLPFCRGEPANGDAESDVVGAIPIGAKGKTLKMFCTLPETFISSEVVL